MWSASPHFVDRKWWIFSATWRRNLLRLCDDSRHSRRLRGEFDKRPVLVLVESGQYLLLQAFHNRPKRGDQCLASNCQRQFPGAFIAQIDLSTDQSLLLEAIHDSSNGCPVLGHRIGQTGLIYPRASANGIKGCKLHRSQVEPGLLCAHHEDLC